MPIFSKTHASFPGAGVVPKKQGRSRSSARSNGASQRGFTLVEVLVALVVVGVALPALLSQVMAQVDGTVALREQTVAHWVAQNQWARFQLMHRLQGQSLNGTDSGEEEMLDRRWQWRAESDVVDMELFKMKQLTISVGPPDQTPLVELRATLHE